MESSETKVQLFAKSVLIKIILDLFRDSSSIFLCTTCTFDNAFLVDNEVCNLKEIKPCDGILFVSCMAV